MEGEADATFLFPGAGRAGRSTPEFGVLGEAQATALRSLHWGVRGASRTSDLQWQLQGQQSFLWVIPLELWAQPGAVPPPPSTCTYFPASDASCLRGHRSSCFLQRIQALVVTPQNKDRASETEKRTHPGGSVWEGSAGTTSTDPAQAWACLTR